MRRQLLHHLGFEEALPMPTDPATEAQAQADALQALPGGEQPVVGEAQGAPPAQLPTGDGLDFFRNGRDVWSC